MTDADSLLTKTSISIALAFKGNQASAFGYLAKVFERLFLGCIVAVLRAAMMLLKKRIKFDAFFISYI